MRTGGIRRVFIPGNLGFPKGLPSGPGKPRIAPGAPLIFDVELVYCPGEVGLFFVYLLHHTRQILLPEIAVVSNGMMLLALSAKLWPTVC